MPRIPNNLHEREIGKLDAGMSSYKISNDRKHLTATAANTPGLHNN